jgi:toxin ParE1/3/4
MGYQNKMKVLFSPDAAADLQNIFDYIALDNAGRAAKFVDDLSQAAVEIGDFPFAWPLIPRYEIKGYRRRTHNGYVIFFEVTGGEILILRILHGARDFERLLFRQDRA